MNKAMVNRFARVESMLGDQELCDVLADMMHYAEAAGLDFAGALDTATMHYEAERGDGDDIEQDVRRMAEEDEA